MDEDEARSWLEKHCNVSRETWRQLEAYTTLLLAESEQQNLIAASTREQIWARHIVDSAQLLLLAPQVSAQENENTLPPLWIDLGSGAGLPGMVVAILSGYDVLMIEMRRKRAEFLNHVILSLGLANAQVFCGKTERAETAHPAAVISARAYAPIERLIPSALHLADFSTIWLLPKGQNHQNELAIAERLWHCEASTQQSVTAADSAILRLSHVRRHGVKFGKAGGKA